MPVSNPYSKPKSNKVGVGSSASRTRTPSCNDAAGAAAAAAPTKAPPPPPSVVPAGAAAAAATFSQSFQSIEDSSYYRRESRRHLSSASSSGNERETREARAQQRAFEAAAAAAAAASNDGSNGAAAGGNATSASDAGVDGMEQHQRPISDRDHHVMMQPHVLYVSNKQRGNGVLNFIRNVPVAYSQMVPDYIMSPTRCALFLSCKYHALYPNYVHRRIAELRTDFALRILLVLVDVKDNASTLRQLNKLSCVNGMTMICCWSDEEVARYLETIKAFDGRDAALIQKRDSSNFVDQVSDYVTACRGGVNKTDAQQLVTQFGSLRAAMSASMDELGLVPGLGEKKVKRLHDAFHKPFSTRAAAARKRRKKEEEERLQRQQENEKAEEGEGSVGDDVSNGEGADCDTAAVMEQQEEAASGSDDVGKENAEEKQQQKQKRDCTGSSPAGDEPSSERLIATAGKDDLGTIDHR